MKSNTLILILIISIIACFGTAIGLYYLNFKSQLISNESQHWAEFGDYFGGVLNPLLALLNLIILTYLSIRLVKVDDDRSNWTLQELARPFPELNYHTTFKGISIKLNNSGLGPMIIDSIIISDGSGKSFTNFLDLLRIIKRHSPVNPRAITYHLSNSRSAISKDHEVILLRIRNKEINDDFKQYVTYLKDELSKYTIEVKYEDMYGRKMPTLLEKIDFPAI